MRYIYLLLLLFPLRGIAQQSAALTDSILKDTFNIPFLQDIVDYYYYYHYDFPNNSSELIQFSGKIAKELSLQYYNAEKVIWEVTIPKLEYYKDNLVLQKKDIRSFDMLLFDSLMTLNTDSCNYVFYPCDIVEYIGGTCEDYKFFLSRYKAPVYYDLKDEPILYPKYVSFSKHVKSKLHELEKTYIEKSCYHYHNACMIPLKTFYEYRSGNGLFFYCTQEKVSTNCIYFKELEKYLSSICQKEKINRLIFLAPEL